MTRIRLRVEERPLITPCAYTDPQRPGGPPVSLPLLRLTASAFLQAPPGARKPSCSVTALIDTGSWLSVVEATLWRRLDVQGLLEHLPFVGSEPQIAFLAGHSVAYTLGRLWVTLADATPTGIVSLPAVPVIAQLLQNPTPLLSTYPLILGLHRGVLDGRKLTREPVAPQPAALATDCGRAHGQEWFLESA